jgi:hypothetical protein
MASGYSPWWKRHILYKVPGLFKVCPGGNYHWKWGRICFCMLNEYDGDEGGIYDFKQNVFFQGDLKIVKRKKK